MCLRNKIYFTYNFSTHCILIQKVETTSALIVIVAVAAAVVVALLLLAPQNVHYIVLYSLKSLAHTHTDKCGCV